MFFHFIQSSTKDFSMFKNVCNKNQVLYQIDLAVSLFLIMKTNQTKISLKQILKLFYQILVIFDLNIFLFFLSENCPLFCEVAG